MILDLISLLLESGAYYEDTRLVPLWTAAFLPVYSCMKQQGLFWRLPIQPMLLWETSNIPTECWRWKCAYIVLFSSDRAEHFVGLFHWIKWFLFPSSWLYWKMHCMWKVTVCQRSLISCVLRRCLACRQKKVLSSRGHCLCQYLNACTECLEWHLSALPHLSTVTSSSTAQLPRIRMGTLAPEGERSVN